MTMDDDWNSVYLLTVTSTIVTLILVGISILFLGIRYEIFSSKVLVFAAIGAVIVGFTSAIAIFRILIDRGF